ncbi:outer membrane protein assembly factor BamE [Catenovulum sp. SM1970]|uniref:outer membrane protein assembly factor BamE n=1 Tax=Marinifaba aquimaris TaxID=2741323 RepID=UPI00157418AB|nr:outer membrane protein assembly factor BamE [Marinifaba aquimaris]NTS78795.1 outer membrane protein assembly factor BamE [Marinifaba aquimaris]
MKALLKVSIVACFVALLTACPYRINVLQGNFVEQNQVDKLRIEMTKEQVIYVLGKPIIEDAFDPNVWHYVYDVQYGDGRTKRTELVLTFEQDKLTTMSGDFEEPENFDQPLIQ